MWLISCCLIISVLYLVLIGLFFVGWRRIPYFEPAPNESLSINLSVVVACCNEEIHLPNLLSVLVLQTYSDFELILINDHSTDNTQAILDKAKTDFPKIQVLNTVGFGKKNALKEAIHKATGDFIVTTDADCIPTIQWLETIVRFQLQYPSELIICPVKLDDNKTIFSRLQRLEFTSLVASGAGAVGAGMPILCNGANLAFTKNAWLKSQNDLHEEEQSGDDIFLLQSIKKQGGVIRFLKSESAFVTTESATSVAAFLKQRRRWAAKSPAYTDWQLIFTACIVFAMSLIPFLLFFNTFFNSSFWIVLFAFFGFKYLLDTLFLCSVRLFFQLKYVWIYSFLLSVIYPFYVVSVGVSALLFKPTSWK